MGKVGKSISKGFKKVSKAVITTPLKQIKDEAERTAENVGAFISGVAGGDASGGTTVIQQSADTARQRYSSEEGQATEQGATDLKTRLGVNDKKKIKRLSKVSSK